MGWGRWLWFANFGCAKDNGWISHLYIHSEDGMMHLVWKDMFVILMNSGACFRIIAKLGCLVILSKTSWSDVYRYVNLSISNKCELYRPGFCRIPIGSYWGKTNYNKDKPIRHSTIRWNGDFAPKLYANKLIIVDSMLVALYGQSLSIEICK